MDRGIGQVHGSMVDRGAYPFASSNRGHRCWIQRMERKRPGQRWLWVTRLGYMAAGSPETDRNGASVRSQRHGGRGGDVSEALEGRR
jgi:hypothetical protein